jgi:hypothetical protein
MASRPNRRLKGPHILLLAVCLALALVNCRSEGPRQGWNKKKWGPVVPHHRFPADCGICHVPDRWDALRDDFSFDHEEEAGYPLEGAHAQAACLRCHNDRGPVQVYANRGCGGCHPDPHTGSLGPDCRRCHEQTSWRPTGLVVEHARTRFPLMGAHVAAPCESCHPGASAGHFRGAPTACDLCHRVDLVRATSPNHAASGWTTNCDRCHTPVTWERAQIVHDFFPLVGGHAGLACTQCHSSGTFGPIPSNCSACHTADYQRAAGHVAQAFPQTCDQCHRTTAWLPTTYQHAAFPLTGGHAGVSCTQCHTGGTFGPILSTCYSCHTADYQGAPNHAAQAFPHTCEQCHSTAAWLPATYQHTAFPLTGGHAGVSCTQCHTGGTFGPIPSACYSCHTADYQGAPNHAAQAFPHTCEQCHSTAAWLPATYQHTAFSLTAGHAGLPCTQCHTGGTFGPIPSTCYSCHATNYQAAPDHATLAFSHSCEQCHTTTAWLPSTFSHTTFALTGGHAGRLCSQCHSGTLGPVPSACYSCHTADYQRAPDHVAQAFPHTCEQCHSTAAWLPAASGHTSFPLTAGHAGLACTQCHTSGVFGPVPSTCYSCHATRYQAAPDHAALAFSHSCEQCHTTMAWLPSTFSHTTFALTGGHAGRLCSQCHTGALGPIPSTCYSCHAANYQAAPNHVTLAFPQNCEQCHTTAAWLPSTFSHTTFPLTGGHNGLRCVQCHTSGVFGPIPSTCYSCHATNYQAAPDHAALAFSHSCEQCHTTTVWRPSTFSHTTFALTGGHAGRLCSQCHTGTLGPIPSTCYSCHATNYQQAPNHVAQGYPQTCEQCHSTTAWLPATYQHTSFPLTGGHAGLTCAQCHTSGTVGPIPSACYSCHAGSYQQAPNHVALAFPQNCAQCHTTTAWLPSTFQHTSRYDSHHNATCTQCHTGGNTSTFNCLNCHTRSDTDSHHSGRPGYIYSSDACYQCHPGG